MTFGDALIYFFKMIENIAIIASSMIVAIHFDKPWMILFLAVIPLNTVNITHPVNEFIFKPNFDESEDEDETDE